LRFISSIVRRRWPDDHNARAGLYPDIHRHIGSFGRPQNSGDVPLPNTARH
jgi:hypothetical protein